MTITSRCTRSIMCDVKTVHLAYYSQERKAGVTWHREWTSYSLCSISAPEADVACSQGGSLPRLTLERSGSSWRYFSGMFSCRHLLRNGRRSPALSRFSASLSAKRNGSFLPRSPWRTRERHESHSCRRGSPRARVASPLSSSTLSPG